MKPLNHLSPNADHRFVLSNVSSELTKIRIGYSTASAHLLDELAKGDLHATLTSAARQVAESSACFPLDAPLAHHLLYLLHDIACQLHALAAVTKPNPKDLEFVGKRLASHYGQQGVMAVLSNAIAGINLAIAALNPPQTFEVL